MDKFQCKVGESALQFDDEYMVSLSYSISHVTSLLSNHSSGVHPIFMKNSFISQRDDVAELVNVDTFLASDITQSLVSHQQRLDTSNKSKRSSKRVRKSSRLESTKLLLKENTQVSRTRSSRVKFNKENGLIEVDKQKLIIVDEEDPIVEETRESFADKYGEIQKARTKQNWASSKTADYGVIMTEDKVCELSAENAPIN